MFGEDPSVRRPKKYILTEMNVKKGSLKSETSPKGKEHFYQKALRWAPSKLFGIFKVHELVTIQAAF
ncbi:hypothetical protein [Methanosarcina barkeri]|uniref:hypothetical protein n=1 Tax=Methanosarcina barkeri TaxID=2208 RepID=UPI00064F3B8A|nr:hypothetical protein [Methanosarcina barkeri]